MHQKQSTGLINRMFCRQRVRANNGGSGISRTYTKQGMAIVWWTVRGRVLRYFPKILQYRARAFACALCMPVVWPYHYHWYGTIWYQYGTIGTVGFREIATPIPVFYPVQQDQFPGRAGETVIVHISRCEGIGYCEAIAIFLLEGFWLVAAPAIDSPTRPSKPISFT